ncbi:hypothetical protein Taro_025925 [Colocasia esculenta]|uniref:Uncharacterized protein n=1 Tax=Colocasia esculenta TaxID=4460 RepID=A0A843VJ21_COLES|nr:hypothetical protein [Colocasia esculenta]
MSRTEYDLELVFVKNFHEFVDDFLKRPEFVELMRRHGALGDANQDRSKERLWSIHDPAQFRLHVDYMHEHC